MEAPDTANGPRKARPILNERDCLAVRQILNERVRSLSPFLEEGRFEGLIRELGRYEQLSAQGSPLRGGEPPPSRAVPALQRRWSDAPA